MSDALDAIVDIKEAMNEYGSTVILQTVTEGGYDFDIGMNTTTTININKKALISTLASRRMNENLLQSNQSYDLAIKLYHDGEIKKTDNILVDTDTYEIVSIVKKVLQDEVLLYELALKK